MEKIATTTYSFERLRQGGFVYVDKTGVLLPLVDGSNDTQFFIARPRRFGKSLAISTLQCLFEGRRDLFQGLAIEPKWDWSKNWPVIRLDMGTIQAESPRVLERAIIDLMRSEGERLGVALDTSLDPASVFRNLVIGTAKLGADGKCVVLIDEYDKPILNHLGESDVADYQRILKPFYGVVKYTEGLQRFALLTGVSKFAKVSVFSDLNNLNDMTMDASTATLFGYTHDEVKANFPESLRALGEREGLDDEATFDKLVQWYDGYRFEEESLPVFSPLSIGKCLTTRKFDAYWFETAAPTFLMGLMRDNPLPGENIEVSQTAFSAYEPSKPALIPLLYQTGYLTIKGDHWDGDDHLFQPRFSQPRGAEGVLRVAHA